MHVALCCSPLDAHASPKLLLEVSAQQDVQERVDAATGITETDGEVVADVKGWCRLSHPEIDKLQDVVRSHAENKHADKHKHHPGQPHDPLPGNASVVTAAKEEESRTRCLVKIRYKESAVPWGTCSDSP